MFSLGHSTIVTLGSVAIAATALTLQHRIDAVKAIGGVIGTLVSALFLFCDCYRESNRAPFGLS
jgi:high-affinity nickel-transport protein